MSTRRVWHRVVLMLWMGVVGVLLTGTVSTPASAQGLGGAGTVQGTVKDPTGGVMASVTVTISNAVTGYTRSTTTDSAGKFTFRNLSPNNYHVAVTADGFQPGAKDIDVRTGVPITVELTLQLTGATAQVSVVGHTEPLEERDPVMHVDLDQSLMEKLPIEASSGLNAIITNASPGIAADANGFFRSHGGSCADADLIDNQPVTDQQSRIYSNQLPPDAIQSVEVMNGVAPAEYGDKSSLVVQVVTKSGLGATPTGSLTLGYGSFSSPTGDFTGGFGNGKFGNFMAVSGMRTDRFLDSPEFVALHDTGHQQSIFDRLDVQTSPNSTLHLNVRWGGSSFDAPNSYDAACVPACVEPGATGPATQHQTIGSYDVAPGYSQVLSSSWLLTANGYARGDHVVYLPSGNPFNDVTASVSQDRRLTNLGGKVDVDGTLGVHEVKFGAQVSVTPLTEKFTLGLTDPAVNAPCVDANGNPVPDTTLTSPGQCAGAGYTASTDLTNATGVGFLPGLAPFDLTRGGSLLNFNGSTTIKEEAAYVEDSIKLTSLTLMAGLRLDNYDGLATASALSPRAGVTYKMGSGGPVVRASYGHFLETPYNENLILSSATGVGGLANILGSQQTPLAPGRRNHVDVGITQDVGHWFLLDAGYFWKFTTGAYDFDNILGTPIAFPIEWQSRNSRDYRRGSPWSTMGGSVPRSSWATIRHGTSIRKPVASCRRSRPPRRS